MPKGIKLRRLNWEQASQMGLDFSRAFTLDPALRGVAGGLPASRPPPPPRRKAAGLRVAFQVPTYHGRTVPRVPAFAIYRRPQVSPLRAMRLLYLDRGKGDLYMEVAVPDPGDLTHFYRVSKKLETDVKETCIICGAHTWKLASKRVVTRTEKGISHSCFKLSFVCRTCGRGRLSVGTKLRSLIDKTGRSIGEVFRRIKGFEISGAPKNLSIKVALTSGKYVLERC